MSGSDLFTGTLELLILRTVQGAALHGYAIAKHIRDTSHGVLDVEEGALYPALHRMERKGLLESAWGRTETNRRAKFYSLTKAGAAKLASDAERWSSFSTAVDTVLDPARG
jgi:PadR family transcriptional regulator PadR